MTGLSLKGASWSFRQDSLDRPAVPKSRRYGKLVYASDDGPFPNGPGIPVVRQVASVAFVLLLNCVSGPNAIVRGISTVIIYAFECVAGVRLCSHVCQKVLESKPSLTDGDTAAPIAGVDDAARVSATFEHASPCAIFSCLSFSVSPVFAGVALQSFPSTKLVENHAIFRTAVATADYVSRSSWREMFRPNDCSSAKPLAQESVGMIRGAISHVALLRDVVRAARRLTPGGPFVTDIPYRRVCSTVSAAA